MKIISKLTLSTFILIMFFFSSCSDEKREFPVYNFEDIAKYLSNESIKIKLNPDDHKVINCSNGGKIYIPENTFQFKDGSNPSKPIKLAIKESFSLAEMIADQLSTTSGSQILETAGMLKITAESEGKELLIKNGKAICISFPKIKGKEDFNLFYLAKEKENKDTWVQDFMLEKFEYDQDPMIEVTEIIRPRLQSEIDRTRIFTDSIKRTTKTLSYGSETADYELYDYKLKLLYASKTLSNLKLRYKKTLVTQYLNDSLSVSQAIIDRAALNGWVFKFYFNIGRNGKIRHVNPEKKENNLKYNQDLETILNQLKKIPKIWPYDGSALVNSNYEFYIEFHAKGIINKHRLKIKYDEQFSKIREEARLKMKIANQYFFTANKLSWINCDRFWNNKNPRITYKVKVEEVNDPRISIIFEDIKGLIQGKFKNGYFIIENIPIGSKLKILGVGVKNGKPAIQIKETKAGKEPIELNQFEEMTLSQFEKELSSL